MNTMKRIVITAGLLASAVTAGAVENIAAAQRRAGTPSMTLEEQNAKRQELMRKMYARTGGRIARPHAAGGKFVFINMQGIVPEREIDEPVSTIVRVLQHDVTLEAPAKGGAFSLAQIPSLMERQQAKGAIFLVEDDTCPSVLVAPESGWGIVNVKRLNADSPNPVLLAQRVRREMWRAFAMVNGAANTNMGKCLLQTVLSLKDLDALQAEAFCPEPVNLILAHLDALGVKKYQHTTYRQACIEGWAPMPTNDIQRAIWEQVHAVPKNPMKIEFDPKKGR